MEIASGSLGHGLPLGVGLAHGLIARGLLAARVYVLVGDAELDEGSNSEAIVYAGATGLPNLTVAGCGRWKPPALPSCWSSPTWRERPRSPCLRRWLRGRTGC